MNSPFPLKLRPTLFSTRVRVAVHASDVRTAALSHLVGLPRSCHIWSMPCIAGSTFFSTGVFCDRSLSTIHGLRGCWSWQMTHITLPFLRFATKELVSLCPARPSCVRLLKHVVDRASSRLADGTMNNGQTESESSSLTIYLTQPSRET